MKFNVLITSLGSNTSIGVIKALKKDKRLRIIGVDTNPSYLCAGYIFVDDFIQVPFASDRLYIPKIIGICNEFNIDVIIPIHDIELDVISENLKVFSSTKCAVNSYEIIQKCNDKLVINNLLKNNIKIPELIYNNTSTSSSIIIKPRKGVSSIGIKVFNNKRKKEVKFDASNEFAQEYIEGKEYTVDCFSSYDVKSTIFKYSVRERVETKSGMSTKGKIVDIPILGKYCELIHSTLNYRGVSNIQFIECNNEYYFIEINPRFAGGGILTYLSGLNFPLYTIWELVGLTDKENIKTDNITIGNQMVRYLSETFFDQNGKNI